MAPGKGRVNPVFTTCNGVGQEEHLARTSRLPHLHPTSPIKGEVLGRRMGQFEGAEGTSPRPTPNVIPALSRDPSCEG